MMHPLITQLGGRRFILTLGCGMATTMLVWFGKIDGMTYSAVIIATVAAYITGNTWQKKNVDGQNAE
jgi:hypothetical protein